MQRSQPSPWWAVALAAVCLIAVLIALGVAIWSLSLLWTGLMLVAMVLGIYCLLQEVSVALMHRDAEPDEHEQGGP